MDEKKEDRELFRRSVETFTDISKIYVESIASLTVRVGIVEPITTYAHSGETVYNRAVICAIPKTVGSIVRVVDGTGVDI